MKYLLNVVFVLTLVVFASANPHQRPEPLEETDADLFRQFIECARIAIVTGIPEIGVPSHDPLVISYDFRQDIDLLGQVKGYVYLGNMMIKDIPNWEVRQFDELSANDDGIETFNYTIYWRDMIFTADYKIYLDYYNGDPVDLEGIIKFELDHLNFFGVFNFTKAGPTRSQTINDLDLHVSTEGVQFDITNLGQVSDAIHNAGEELASDINAYDYTEISEALKSKLINDWILKQERIDAIVENCRK